MSKTRKQALQNQNVTPPAVQYDNPWLEAAAESGSEFGKILKFAKGEWSIGDDTVPENTEYVAYIDQLLRGWVRFEDGAVVDRKITKVATGLRPPTREELGDTDPSEWKETDADGKPRDPWVVQWMLPLAAIDIQDLVVFVTGSKGGIAAIGNLCRVYGRTERNGLLPIVALKTRSYKHKEYGKIETPDLPIISWHGTATTQTAAVNPAASAAAAPINDEIPY